MTYKPGEVARRTAIINEMVANGATSADIAKRLKLSTSSVFAFIEKHRLQRPASGRKVSPTDHMTADASVLTPEQIEQARRVGIAPGRYAWLLTCRHEGNATGWRGGAAIG